MNQIGNPPLDYPAGLSFDYSVWSPGTVVTLCSVPWGSDYRDVVKFDDHAALNRYLDDRSGPTVTYERMSYARVGDPVRIPLPFNDAYRFNYLRVTNNRQPVGESHQRSYYYFIQDVRHISPNTTELVIQLDVWQSFNHYMEFGTCYLERGHAAIADNKAMDNYGRKYLTQPEGMDLGGEYAIDHVYRKDLGTAAYPYSSFNVLVASTVRLAGDLGSMESPQLTTAGGSDAEGLPNGVEFTLFETVGRYMEFMALISQAPWASQGIISVMVIPHGVIDLTKCNMTTITVKGQTKSILSVGLTAIKTSEVVTLANDFRADLQNKKLTGTRYENLTKFLTYPYTLVELTTYTGTPLILKPEAISAKTLSCTQMNHVVLPGPRIAFTPRDYNKGTATGDGIDDGGEFMDMQTGFFNFPTFSVVNNGYMSYMASQANTIAYQHQAADWSQQRALTGNQLGYDQSSAGMQLNSTLTNMQNTNANQVNSLQNNVATQRAVVGAVQDIGGGLGGGAAGLAGGAVKAAFRGVDTAIGINANNQATNLATGLGSARTNATNANAGYVRDTNKDYADFAAKGDYSNSIAAINAKVQDAKMIQPTTSGQVGGDAFMLATYKWQLVAKVKMIQENAMNVIGEYWLRYGYAINRFMKMPKSLMTMEKFTYWRVKELYITSANTPEFAKQTIRGIFEKGVTVWANAADIGRIDIADNEPIRGDYL